MNSRTVRDKSLTEEESALLTRTTRVCHFCHGGQTGELVTNVSSRACAGIEIASWMLDWEIA